MRNFSMIWCVLAVVAAASDTGYAAVRVVNAEPNGQASAETQASAGALEGTVTDATKAVIPGAAVKVRDSSGKEVSATADELGHYSVTGLAAGAATVTISFSGFVDFTATAQVAASGKTALDAQLQPAGGAATNVEVTAQRANQVQTENAEVSGEITEERIVGFGLNGRNFSSLITLSPGVSNQTGQDEAKVGVVGSAKFSVNGGRTEYNTFDVDGNDVLNTDIAASQGHSTLLVYPSLDAIQDIKVLTSNYGAQYGRSASGTVLVQLKSGAEKIRGNAYEFIRNEAFNARNYFDLPGKAPLYRRHDFGFTFGGPVSISHLLAPQNPKTFFFVSEEWRKERTPLEFNQGVPSDAERGYNLASNTYTSIADFSDVCPTSLGATIKYSTSAYPDCPGQGFGGTNYTYESNQFYIDPNATAYLQAGLIPRANSTSGCTSSIGSCYVAAVSPATDYREDLIRIDHNFSEKWKFFANGVHDHWQTVTAVPQWAAHVNSFPSVMNSFLGPGISTVGHITTVVTPTLLNDFSVGLTWQKTSLESIPGPGVSLSASNLDAVPDSIGSFFANCGGGEFGPNNSCIGGKLPGLVFGGTNAEYGGAGFNVDTSYMPWFNTRFVGTITENMTKFFTRHSLAFGAQVVGAKRHEFGAANGANSGDQQGLLTFRNVSTDATSGNSFADFEFNNGTPSYSSQYGGKYLYSYQQDNTQTTYKVSYGTLEPYFQDDFKVSPRLTLNVGARISLFQNWQPDGEVLYNWDPAAFNPDLVANSNLALNPLRGYFQNATTGEPSQFDGSTLNPALTNGLVQCGVNGVPKSCQTSHVFNFAPRLGAAWDPTGSGKTSIRAGYGVFYEHGTGSEANAGSLMSNPPQVLSMTEDYPESYAQIGLQAIAGDTNVKIESPLNMVSIPGKTIWPYIQQWSFGVQRELNATTQFGVAYVGSKGTHLAIASQLNQLPPVAATVNPFLNHEPITQQLCLGNQINPSNLKDPNAYFYFPDSNSFLYYGKNAANQPYNPAAFTALVAACDGTQGADNSPSIAYALNFMRPLQGIGNVLAIRNQAGSNYNSFQAVAHHVSGPLDVAGVLTYSHSIDTASDRFSSTFVDYYNLRANRASSDFDERILLNINYIYQLPLLRFAQLVLSPPPSDDPNAPKWTPDPKYGDIPRLTRAILSDWSVSGVTIYQTGTPFSVINSASGNGISVLDNAGLALGEGADSYPDAYSQHGRQCFSGNQEIGSVGPVIGNRCQFLAPRGLTQGSAGRNFLNNPARTNFDAALLKDMKLAHGTTLEFRAEAFNLFNTTQFILYDPNKGNTASNTVSCYGDVTTGYSAGAPNCTTGNGFLHPVAAHRPRTVQFGLKYQF